MKLLTLWVAFVFCLMLAAICASCAGIHTQHQQIATTCEGAASAADSIAAGTNAGRITSDQAKEALRVYRLTTAFCEPQPATSLGSADYATLLSAAAELSALSEKSR